MFSYFKLLSNPSALFFMRQLPTYIQFQGDQIGQIFAAWVIVYFGQLFENYKSFFCYFFHITK
jgi:hypothetical protein